MINIPQRGKRQKKKKASETELQRRFTIKPP